MIFRAIEKHEALTTLRNDGNLRGVSTGFRALDEIFTLKKGYPLFIAGSPHHGKTEFILDVLVNTSILHGWKHFVYAGETGSVEETIAELAHKFIKKPLRKKVDSKPNSFAMNDLEYAEALEWVDKHFYFLDSETDFTINGFYSFVSECENKHGVKFDTTLIDPFNDVIEELSKYGNREDKWLKDALKKVRQDSKKNDRINILVNHIADIAPAIDKSTGKRFTPVAMPSEWAGGRTWHRRAFTMLLVYRPQPFMNDDTGKPVEPNESWIINQKAKPKGSGRLGQCSLFWNWQINRFNDTCTLNDMFVPKTAETLPYPKQMQNKGSFYEVDKDETPF